MEVYIEDVIVDNFVIDFCLLFLTGKLLKLKRNMFLLILASSIGVASVFASIYFSLSGFSLFAFKLIVAWFMTLVAFKEKGKKLLLAHFSFLVLTAVMGGICFLICFSFGEVVLLPNGEITYNLFLPIWAILLCLILIGYILFKLLAAVKIKNMQSGFIYETKVFSGEKEVKCNAFLDSGNTLIDEQTNKPVCIISFDAFRKLFSSINLHELLLKRPLENLAQSHYIKVGSVGKTREMLAFEVDKILLKQKDFSLTQKNVMLAVSFVKLEKKLDCSILLNPLIFNK